MTLTMPMTVTVAMIKHILLICKNKKRRKSRNGTGINKFIEILSISEKYEHCITTFVKAIKQAEFCRNYLNFSVGVAEKPGRELATAI